MTGEYPKNLRNFTVQYWQKMWKQINNNHSMPRDSEAIFRITR